MNESINQPIKDFTVNQNMNMSIEYTE